MLFLREYKLYVIFHLLSFQDSTMKSENNSTFFFFYQRQTIPKNVIAMNMAFFPSIRVVTDIVTI